MSRVALLAILALAACVHTAQAGGVIDPAELLARIVQLEADVTVLKSDAAPIPGRLDSIDAQLDDVIEQRERDHDASVAVEQRVIGQGARLDAHADRLDTHLGRLNNDDARLDLQNGRLNTHDQRLDNQADRLDAIPLLARCILPPLAYRHVTVRTAKGKTTTALVPVKDAPLGFHAGWTWLSRINAQCAKALR